MKTKHLILCILMAVLTFSCTDEVELKNIVNSPLSGTFWIHVQGIDVQTGKEMKIAYWFVEDGIVYEFPVDDRTSKASIMHRSKFQRMNNKVTITKEFSTEVGTIDGDIMRFGSKEYVLQNRTL